MKWLLTYPEDGPSVDFYDQWVRAAGADPVLVDASYTHPGELREFDALLLPGGGDVDPARYGVSERHPKTDGVLPARDQLEIDLIREFQALRRPIFGICRGIQMLNVALGGGLLQHVPDGVEEQRERHRKSKGYDSIHPLILDSSTKVGAALRAALETNSAHHQAVSPQHIGRGLTVAARSPAGIIEAVESFDGPSPVVAVQWHPERLPADHPASAALASFFAALSRRTG